MDLTAVSEKDKQRQVVLLQTGLLLLVVALCYAASLSGNFLWDDDKLITENTALFAPQALLKIWSEPALSPAGTYNPLTLSLIVLEIQTWSTKPFGFHVVSLLLHLINCLLVWRLLSRLGMGLTAAWLAAFIFGIHPVQVGAVASIVACKYLLSAMFYLLALLSYLHFDNKRSPLVYLLALLLFGLAMLSEMMAVTLPVVLLLVFWMQARAFNIRRDIMPLMPFVLLVVCLIVWKSPFNDSLESYDLSIFSRGLLAGRLICHHLSKFIWPWPLVEIYSQWQINASVWSLYLFAKGIVIALIVCAWCISRWGRIPLAVLLLYILVLWPRLGFVYFPVFEYSWVADRFQYLAVLIPIAAAVLLGSVIQGKLSKANDKNVSIFRLLLPAVAILISVVFGYLSFQQSKRYSSMDVLFAHNVRFVPDHWLVRENYGNGLKAKWHWREALIQYQQALELFPENPTIHNNLGGAYGQLKEQELAIKHLKKAIELNPEYARAHYNLALIQMWRNEEREAIEHFQQVLKQFPAWPQPAINIARILSASKDPSIRNGHEAIHYAEQANGLTAHHDPFYLDILAAAYAEDGNFEYAEQIAVKAIDIARQTGMQALAVQLEKRLEGYKNKQPHRGPF